MKAILKKQVNGVEYAWSKAKKITLSPYTIATNCTDITDCNDGISELWDAYDRYKAAMAKVPEYIYKRIEKLNAKRDKCSLKEHGMKYDEWLMHKRLVSMA